MLGGRRAHTDAATTKNQRAGQQNRHPMPLVPHLCTPDMYLGGSIPGTGDIYQANSFLARLSLDRGSDTDILSVIAVGEIDVSDPFVGVASRFIDRRS